MSDEFDVRIAEIQLKQEQEKTLQVSTENRAKKTVGFFNFVVGGLIGAISAAAVAYLSYSGEIEAARLEQANKGREIDLELARLSLTILSGEYQEEVEATLPARMFALNALERGTGVEIPDADKETWALVGITPAGNPDVWIYGEKLSDLDAFPTGAVTMMQAFEHETQRNSRLRQLIENNQIDFSDNTCVTRSSAFFVVEDQKECGPFAFFDKDRFETCIAKKVAGFALDGFEWATACGRKVPSDE